MRSHIVLIALILLVVWVPTKEEAYTPLQSREDTLDIEIQMHGCEIYLPFTVPAICISYMPIEEANSRVTITIEIWHFGRVVENYTHRNYFWHKNQWASLGVIQPRLGIGLYRLVVTFKGDEDETIRLYDHKTRRDIDRRPIDIGTEVKIAKNMFCLPWYIPTLLVVVLAMFTAWYRKGFPYREREKEQRRE